MKDKKRQTWPGDKPSGEKRYFDVTIIHYARMEVDESIIEQGMLPDNPTFGESVQEWEVLRHLAFNAAGHLTELSDIDGYANCPNDSLKLSNQNDDVEVEEVEPD